jgi:hypothetical protein
MSRIVLKYQGLRDSAVRSSRAAFVLCQVSGRSEERVTDKDEGFSDRVVLAGGRSKIIGQVMVTRLASLGRIVVSLDRKCLGAWC